MTHLPTSGTIQDLTPSNIELVVNAYIDQLCGPAQCDQSRARSFIMTALRRAHRDAKNNFEDWHDQCLKIDSILQVVPHVKLKTNDGDEEEWLAEREINYRVIWEHGRWVFLFENHDDAMLFKLKWYK